MTQTTPHRTLAELEAALVAGDRTITPEMLTAAEAAQRHAELLAEADAVAAREAGEAGRQAQLQTLRDDITAFADSLGTDLADRAEKAVSELSAVLSELQAGRHTVTGFVDRARKLDTPGGDTAAALHEVDDTSAGIAWHRRPGSEPAVAVDGRVVRVPEPWDVLARAERDLMAAHGLSAKSKPVRVGTTIRQLLDLRPRKATEPTVMVKLLAPHGHRAPGQVDSLPLSVARQLTKAGAAIAHGAEAVRQLRG